REARPLRIEPQPGESGSPFYAKLRAEAMPSLLRDGRGELYLGFHLDPLYHVHWNNLTPPIQVEIALPEGAAAEPALLQGPKLRAPSDIDPREFLTTLDMGGARGPIRLKVSYFACNDDEGWCKAIRQEYVVHLEADPDGGWVQGRRGGRSRPGQLPADPNRTMAMGWITAVDAAAGTLSVFTLDLEERTFRVDDQTRLLRGGPARLQDFESGDAVRLTFAPRTAEGEPPRVIGLRLEE
ncbi:MAG: hypothetical protein ACREJB_09755, partial [Planctomycetaceae bacterium]